MTLWGGAFNQQPVDAVRKLNDSLRFDWRLYAVDIQGSIAWANALHDAGILSAEERDLLAQGLARVHDEFASGEFTSAPGDEDIHTAVERRLGEIVGSVAGKLHTGRSRNDQIATDLLLWLLETVQQVRAGLVALGAAIVAQAGQHANTLLPGYTHFQPAQPITAAHWWLNHFWPLTRDVERLSALETAWRQKCPLGSGALAGSAYPIDRDALALALGFTAATPNSLDAVADRDHGAEFLFALALAVTHFSRLAEDVIVFANPRLGFVRLDERFSTGSSIMPQKRNPDPLELARGKAGRLTGHLAGFLATLKGLPTGYNKDLQEDKEPLFDATDTILTLLPAITGLVAHLELVPDAMRAALDDDLLATDLADALALKGMPFREAHGLAGQAVHLAASRSVPLSQLTPDDLRGISSAFDGIPADVFDFAAAVRRRGVVRGGTGDFEDQIAQARAWLAEQDDPGQHI